MEIGPDLTAGFILIRSPCPAGQLAGVANLDVDCTHPLNTPSHRRVQIQGSTLAARHQDLDKFLGQVATATINQINPGEVLHTIDCTIDSRFC